MTNEQGGAMKIAVGSKEILEAWFSTPMNEGEAQSAWNRQQIDRVKAIEERYASRR